MQNLRIALFQANQIWMNPKLNMEKLSETMSLHYSKIDLIVIPEMYTTGFTMFPIELAINEFREGKYYKELIELSANYNTAIAGSFIWLENGSYSNRFLFIHPNGEVDFADKRHLFTLAGEQKAYVPGNKKVTVNFNGFKIKIFVCYDLRFPVWCRNENTDAEKSDLYLFVANWPEKRIEHWRSLLQARAIENQVYVAGVNRVGSDGNDVIYTGFSTLIHPNGTRMIEMPNNESLEIAELSKQELNDYRKSFPFLEDSDSFELQY